jgi:hypothetical protein
MTIVVAEALQHLMVDEDVEENISGKPFLEGPGMDRR